MIVLSASIVVACVCMAIFHIFILVSSLHLLLFALCLSSLLIIHLLLILNAYLIREDTSILNGRDRHSLENSDLAILRYRLVEINVAD